MLSISRSNQIVFVITLAVVAFAVGLVLALWGSDGAMRVIGALGIATGLFLLASPRRHLLKRNPGVSFDVQLRVEHTVLRRMRMLGAAGTLMGMALMLPDNRLRMGLMLCSAAASMAGAFKVPRRFFVLEGGAG